MPKIINVESSAGTMQLQVNPGDTFSDLVSRASASIGQDLTGAEIWTRDGKADATSGAFERLEQDSSVKLLPGVVVGGIRRAKRATQIRF